MESKKTPRDVKFTKFSKLEGGKNKLWENQQKMVVEGADIEVRQLAGVYLESPWKQGSSSNGGAVLQ